MNSIELKMSDQGALLATLRFRSFSFQQRSGEMSVSIYLQVGLAALYIMDLSEDILPTQDYSCTIINLMLGKAGVIKFM